MAFGSRVVKDAENGDMADKLMICVSNYKKFGFSQVYLAEIVTPDRLVSSTISGD